MTCTPFVLFPPSRFVCNDQACLRRERESLAGRRKEFNEERAMDRLVEELTFEVEAEERTLSELVREDIEVMHYHAL